MLSLQVHPELLEVALVETQEPSSLETMQRVVGGYIEPLFTIRGPVAGRAITAYVNDEGFLHRLPVAFQVVRPADPGYAFVQNIAGNTVFAGLDKEGNTLELNTAEVDFIKKTLRLGVQTGVVVLPGTENAIRME